MNEQKILETLNKLNRWWIGEEIPKIILKSKHKRRDFFTLIDKLNDQEIKSIVGPRQVGKTTLMGQLIENQIKSDKIDPKKIIYIPVDNTMLLAASDNILEDCLKIYSQYILGTEFGNLKENIYVYLDEIQHLGDWAEQLKTWYDMYDKLRFFITGSSSTKIRNDASESLVGRVERRTLMPFKFIEFLRYRHIGNGDNINELSLNLRRLLRTSLDAGDPEPFFQDMIKTSGLLANVKTNIISELNSYLIKGGYPTIIDYGTNYYAVHEKLFNDLELTVYKDIKQNFNIDNPDKIMAALTLLADSTGQIVSISGLRKELGIEWRTVENYLYYLDATYLINQSKCYSTNIRKRERKGKKIYLTDVGQRNVLLSQITPSLLSSSDLGLVIQTAAFHHAVKLKYRFSEHTNFQVYYWREGDVEVDIIIDGNKLLPIEVKSKDNIGGSDLRGLKKFLGWYENCDFGMIITRDKIDLKSNILYIPLWMFLMMC